MITFTPLLDVRAVTNMEWAPKPSFSTREDDVLVKLIVDAGQPAVTAVGFPELEAIMNRKGISPEARESIEADIAREKAKGHNVVLYEYP